MDGNESQIGPVLVSHGGKSQCAIGQIDAFVGGELCPSHACVRDPNVETIQLLALDDASNSAIVNPDPLAGEGVLEHLRRGPPDCGRIEHATDAIAGGRPARCQFSSQDEHVAYDEWHHSVDRRDPADQRLYTNIDATALSPDSDVAGEITGARRLGPRAVDAGGHEIDLACGPPGIGEREAITDHERLQKYFRELEAGVGVSRRFARCLLRREPNPRGVGDTSEHVARRPDLDHARTWLEWTSPELGPAKSISTRQVPAGRQFRSTEMLDHARPRAVIVMRTVDTHAVHTVLDQMLDQAVVNGRLAGHRDHDRDAAVGWHRPEEGMGVRSQEMPPTFQIHRRLI